MNKAQRKELSDLQDKVSALDRENLTKEDRDEHKVILEGVRDGVEAIQQDEQDKYDNMPESLQGGSKGDEMQEGIDNLDEVIRGLDEAIEKLEEEKEFDEEEYASALETAADNFSVF